MKLWKLTALGIFILAKQMIYEPLVAATKAVGFWIFERIRQYMIRQFRGVK